MPAGTGVNCSDCPDKKEGKCNGDDTLCLCYKCPRKLAQCIYVKYCRETESVLYFDNRY